MQRTDVAFTVLALGKKMKDGPIVPECIAPGWLKRRSPDTGRANELEGLRGMCLVPADLGRGASCVDLIPVRLLPLDHVQPSVSTPVRE
jgi:hypothetical protein